MFGHIHRDKRYRYRYLYLAILLISLVPLGLSATVKGPELRGPVADSVLRQQRDSILLSLHLQYLNGANDLHSPYEQITVLEKILELDPNQHSHWFNLGLENMKIHEYEKALEALNKGLESYPAVDNPSLVQIYICLSFCYHKTERYRKEKEVLDCALKIHPENPEVIGRYAIRAHSMMRFTEADHHQEKLIAILRSKGQNESDIAYYLGRLYLNEDYLEAEKYLRTAVQYDPDNPEKMGALAWVLIRNALRIDEGMEVIEKAIAADPGNAVLLHQQGYGFYVQGKFSAALSNLYSAKELYRQFNFEVNTLIEMVENARASLAQE